MQTLIVSGLMEGNTMQQFSYIIRHVEDIDACIRRFREEAPEKYRSILVSVFTDFTDPTRILSLTGKIARAFPSAVIAGAMTTESIQNGAVKIHAVVVSFLVFRSSEVRLMAFDDPDAFAADGKKFCSAAKRVKDLAAVGVIGTLHEVDVQPFLDGLSPIGENVVIFGGGANTLKNVPAFVFAKNEVIEKGLLAILFSGPDLHVHASLNFGWKPLGRDFVITKMTGRHIVNEVDHKPAAHIYEQYLGVVPDSHFSRDTLAFPVFVQRGGSYIARHTVGVREEDGALLFIADLYEGETIRLAYGDPREMIEDAKTGCADMAAFRPEAVVLLNCYAHRMFLRGDVKFELAPFREVAPSCGFYTYGEIFRFAGHVSVHNMMLLSVGFREGEKPAKPLPIRREIPSRFKDSLLLVERLVRFVSATTAELETANRELDHLAHTDYLTQVANRGETEDLLKNAVSAASQSGLPLSVLMIDFDDFKSVNDVYGHNIGDRLLTEASDLFRAHIRQGDTAGRWGGDEFLLILPKAALNDAKRVAERIKQAVSDLRLLPDDKYCTVSIGVAQLRPDETYDDFYRRVDGALYSAKKKGKNRVYLAQ